jgi:hypothetical protein
MPQLLPIGAITEREYMTQTMVKEDLLRLAFATPQKQISKKEQQGRRELAAGMETLIAHFQSMFRTDVVGVEMYPCDCKECVEL